MSDLTLDLGGCNIGLPGATDVVQLRTAPRLRRLSIDLTGNAIPDEGIEALATGFQHARLRALHLAIPAKWVAERGRQALERLRTSSRPKCVTVEVPGLQPVPSRWASNTLLLRGRYYRASQWERHVARTWVASDSSSVV
jgi:hypothetical protein